MNGAIIKTNGKGKTLNSGEDKVPDENGEIIFHDVHGLIKDIDGERSVSGFHLDDGTFGYILKNKDSETKIRLTYKAVEAMFIIAHQLKNSMIPE